MYFNKQQRDYLKLKLSKILDSDFIGKNILKEIKSFEGRQAEIEACQHEDGDYIGEKRCCTKCGATATKGNYEKWTLKSFKAELKKLME